MPQPDAVGVPWIKESEYSDVKELMEDGDTMPDSYSEWESGAESVESKFEEAGHRTIRVFIHPKEFEEWCEANNIAPGSQARQLYSSAKAKEVLEEEEN